MKSGFVAVVGKPNAGKSSMVNNLVGFDVAIITPKPFSAANDAKVLACSGVRWAEST